MENKATEEEEKQHYFDKEKEYDEVIMPLIEMIRVLCVKHDIPFVFGAAVRRDDDGHLIATAAQKTKEGWAPTELVLGRAMMLGNIMPVNIGKPQDIIRAIVHKMADHVEKHGFPAEEEKEEKE